MPAVLTVSPEQWLPGYEFNAGSGQITIDLADLDGLTPVEAEDDFRKFILAFFQKLRAVYQSPVDEDEAHRFDTHKFTIAENVSPLLTTGQLQRTLSIKIGLRPGTEEVIDGDTYEGGSA